MNILFRKISVKPILLILTLPFILFVVSGMNYAHAGCAATILPQPCFDSFMGSTEPITEKSIMENFARYLEVNYPNWKMSDRHWDAFDENLRLPAIICTEFVADGVTQYRMAKWVDVSKISSFEDHRNDLLCNKWLQPIDDGIKITWDKSNYLPNGTGTIQVIDKDMNLDYSKIDSFDMHVWSDIDHKGIQLTMTETDNDSGIFKGTVFFTTSGTSSGTRLLVEDAVHASHKENYSFSRIIYEPEPMPTKEQTANSQILCIDGYRQVGSECVPEDSPTINYAHQWILTILLLIVVLIAILIGIIFGVKFWRNRK